MKSVTIYIYGIVSAPKIAKGQRDEQSCHRFNRMDVVHEPHIGHIWYISCKRQKKKRIICFAANVAI
jgi:hypothetical protein